MGRKIHALKTYILFFLLCHYKFSHSDCSL